MRFEKNILSNKLKGTYMFRKSPLFKFVFNPSLIDGILNVLPYELATYNDYEKSKKWSW